MKENDINKEFEELVNIVIDGELNAEQRQKFDSMMTEEVNRQYFQNICQLQGALESKSGQLSRDLMATSFKASSRNVTSYLTLVAALVVIFLGVRMFVTDGLSKKIANGEVVAKIFKNIFADFDYGIAEGDSLKDGSDVRSGKYSLRNGIVKINHGNGATVIIESPCRYEILSDNSLRLESGKVSVHSPSEVNYKVFCPGVTIEDLGTEFSVDYQENTNLDLYVFKGVVKIETNEENDSDKALLKAGEAIRVIYGRGGELSLAGIDHRNDLFIRQLETPNSKYSREIVKMDPVLYFPMDVVENGSLKDYSIYKNDGVSRGVADQQNFFAQGKFGPAIRVSGANRGSYIFVDDYPKTKDSMITGMAWVKAKSRPKWATIMKNWVDGSKGQFHFGLDEFGYLDIEIMPKDDSFFDSEELQTRDDVSLHGKSIHLRESEKFPLNSWQHVAFVHDSKTLFLYRNGKLVTQLSTPAIKYPSYTKILSLGTKLSKNLKDHSSWKSHWDGMLDEVVIFNKAMSSKEIEYIYNQVYSNKMVD